MRSQASRFVRQLAVVADHSAQNHGHDHLQNDEELGRADSQAGKHVLHPEFILTHFGRFGNEDVPFNRHGAAVSNLLSGKFLNVQMHPSLSCLGLRMPADLEIGDTEGLKPVLRIRSRARAMRLHVAPALPPLFEPLCWARTTRNDDVGTKELCALDYLNQPRVSISLP